MEEALIKRILPHSIEAEQCDILQRREKYPNLLDQQTHNNCYDTTNNLRTHDCCYSIRFRYRLHTWHVSKADTHDNRQA